MSVSHSSADRIRKIATEMLKEYNLEKEFDLEWFLAWCRSEGHFEETRKDATRDQYYGITGTKDNPESAAEDLFEIEADCGGEYPNKGDYIREKLMDFWGHPTHPLEGKV